MNFRTAVVGVRGTPGVLLGAIVVVVLISGCGRSGPERIVVFGEVTHAGEAVAKGMIRFQPIEGTDSPVSFGPIKDGHYRVVALGGVMPGTYQVQIRSYQPTEGPGQRFGPPPTQLLPEKHNKNSEIKITIKSGDNRVEHDFSLEP
jgi:hypothetical protein